MMRSVAGIAALFVAAVPLVAQEEAGRPAGETTSGMLKVAADAERVSPVIPTPQETYWGKGTVEVGRKGAFTAVVEMDGSAAKLTLLPEELKKRVRARFGASPAPAASGARIVFALNAADLPSADAAAAQPLRGQGPEAHVIKAARNRILVVGNSEAALWRGMATLAQSIARSGDALVIPVADIVDYPTMPQRALLVDIGGQGFMVGPSRWEFSQWKEFVDWMVDYKFNDLWLEFIGSGRLMGNLNVDAGEWIGFPLALQSYPQLVCKDRPIRRWDKAQNRLVKDTYTAPNVTREFVRELIDYAQARGVKTHLFIGYDYFANQLPVVLGVPANDPRNPQANKVYDTVLKEITGRYSNAAGVVLCTIENKNVPPEIIHDIIRRTKDAYAIVKAINPKMEVGLLPDYLEWQPDQLEHLRLLREQVPKDVFLAYSPHREPQQKAWQRVHGDVWRYMNYSQYAWDHVAYIFPDRIREEVLGSYSAGYRKTVTQAWYFDIFALNYMALSEYSWNAGSSTVNEFWDKALERQFGRDAAPLMRVALEHTGFGLRFDIIARMIVDGKTDSNFSYWDMYVMHRYKGLTDGMLATVEADARESLRAAAEALPLAPVAAREAVEMTVISAERRLYLATSARSYLKVLALRKAGQPAAARKEMEICLAEAEKMYRAATRLGIEFPLSVHDDEVVEKYRQVANALH
jgi:hypothetical protein